MSDKDRLEQKLEEIARELKWQRKLLIFVTVGVAVLLLPIVIAVIAWLATANTPIWAHLLMLGLTLLVVFLAGAYVVSRVTPSADVLPKNAEREDASAGS